MQRCPPGLRAPRPPQLVDQPVGRDDLVRAQQKDRQQRALLRAAKRDDVVAVGDLEWAEDPKFHRVSRRLAPRKRESTFSRATGSRWAIATRTEEALTNAQRAAPSRSDSREGWRPAFPAPRRSPFT